MSILSDIEIKDLCSSEQKHPMIAPFVDQQVRSVTKDGVKTRVISYGVSSYGYDLRVGREFKIFTNVMSALVDPKDFSQQTFVRHEGPYCIVPPNSFVLASSLEKFHLPDNVTGVVVGKSTYARTGLSTLATPLEAGWSGYLTLEFANTTPLPIKLYAEEGACQVLFFEGKTQCLTTYADRKGKYMNQSSEPTHPLV